MHWLWLSAVVAVAFGKLSPSLQKIQDDYIHMYEQVAETAGITRDMLLAEKQDDYKPALMNFNCSVTPSPPSATSVHALRPNDISVVGAFGDSITAGMGVLADTIFDVILQNRHHVASAGGAETIDTVRIMPNVLKMFNPNLEGYSTAESSPGDPEAGMNVAVGGCTAHCMLDQAQELVQQLTDADDINMANDWKMFTFLIGGNDLCRYCHDRDYYGAERYVSEIRDALDHMRDNIPRTIVNLVLMFDITPLPEMSDNIMCDTLHDIACSCVIDEETRPELKPMQVAYANGLIDLVNSDRYEQADDFTVVIQPGLVDSAPPRLPSGEVDRSYWSPDCFHPGTKAHYVMGIDLWNQLLQPVGQKTRNVVWQMDTPINCPTAERPYIFTRRNSGTGPTVDEPSV